MNDNYMGERRKWLMQGLGFGAGFVLTATVIAGLFSWYNSRPKPWNSSAIKASFHRAYSKSHAVDFDYVLENTTNNDLRLTDAGKADVGVKTGSTDSLFGFGSQNVKLLLPIYIPAKHRTRITVELSGYTVDATDPGINATKAERDNYYKSVAEQISSKMPNLKGFEVFISEGRMEIDMPSGWQKWQPEANSLAGTQ